MHESDVENAALAWFEDQGSRSYLVKGVEVEYLRPDGTNGYDSVLVSDYDEPDNNGWLVVNQFTVTEARGACDLAAHERYLWTSTQLLKIPIEAMPDLSLRILPRWLPELETTSPAFQRTTQD